MTWVVVICAGMAAWLLRKPLAAALLDGRARIRTGQPDEALPRRVVLVAPPRLDHWSDLDRGCARREAARSPLPMDASYRRAA